MLSRKQFGMKRIVLALTSVAFAVTLAGCGTQTSTSTATPKSGSAIVATYNGGKVTAAELNKQVAIEELTNPKLSITNTVKTQIVQQYVLYFKLLAQKEAQAKITVPQSQVSQQLLAAKQYWTQSQYSGSSTAFDAKMQQLNLTDADLAGFIEAGLLLDKYAGTLVKTDPLSAQQQYYKQNIDQFTTVSVRHILVKTLPLAQQIYKDLRNGGSWDKLAKQYSIDTGSKNNGGLYQNQSPANWVPSFAQHAMTQPIGVIGAPFKSRYGYHVMEVLSRKINPFSQVQASIQQQLITQQEQKVLPPLLTNLQKKANIKVTL